MLLDFVKRNRTLELALECDIDQRPARLFARALGVEVVGFRIELGRIRVRVAGDGGGADNPGHVAARVVEQDAVAGLHQSHVVAGLVVAHAVPGFGADPLEVVDRERVRFGFHQPVAARLVVACFVHAGVVSNKRVSRSLQTASMATSHDAGARASVSCRENAAPTSHGGALPNWRNATLRSYQPPPMPRRWPRASKPTRGNTISTIASGSSNASPATSGSGMPCWLVTSAEPGRQGAKRKRPSSCNTGRQYVQLAGNCICQACKAISPPIAQ